MKTKIIPYVLGGFFGLLLLTYVYRLGQTAAPVSQHASSDVPAIQPESTSSPIGAEIAHGESALPHVLLHPGDCLDIIHVAVPNIVNDPSKFAARFGWLEEPRDTPGFEYHKASLDMWQQITSGYMTLHLCNYTDREITPNPVKFWWSVRQYDN